MGYQLAEDLILEYDGNSVASKSGYNYIWTTDASNLQLNGVATLGDVALQAQNIQKQISDLTMSQQMLTKEMETTYISQANYDISNQAIINRFVEVETSVSGINHTLGEKTIDAENTRVVSEIKKHMSFTEEGLRLYSSGDGSQVQTLITQEGMQIQGVNNQNIASFEKDKLVIQRAEINSSLSLGSATKGWYDLIELNNGIAWRWRNRTTQQ